MSAKKKQHRYQPYENLFDGLCDAGCGRPVPYGMTDNYLRTKGWDVAEDDAYVDGKRRICAACLEGAMKS